MATAAGYPPFEGNEDFYFNILSTKYWELNNFWKDVRNRYLLVHEWFMKNNNFFLGPKTNRSKFITEYMMDVKKSLDICMGSIDISGECLSKRMYEFGGIYLIDSPLKLSLNYILNETIVAHMNMHNLLLRFYRMVKELNSLSLQLINTNLRPVDQQNSSLPLSYERSSIFDQSCQISVDQQNSSLQPSYERSSILDQSYQRLVNQQTSSLQPSYERSSIFDQSYQGTNLNLAAEVEPNWYPAHQGSLNMETAFLGNVDIDTAHQGYADLDTARQGYADLDTARQGYVELDTARQGYVDLDTALQGSVELHPAFEGSVGLDPASEGILGLDPAHQDKLVQSSD